MGVTRDTARRTFNTSKYMIDTDPGAVVYRNGIVATNLQMRVWTHALATSTTGAVTFNIPTGTFTTIQYIEANVIRDTADPTLAAFAMIRSYTATSVTVQCFESKTSGVLLGGIVEGLELPTAAVAVMCKVTGI